MKRKSRVLFQRDCNCWNLTSQVKSRRLVCSTGKKQVLVGTPLSKLQGNFIANGISLFKPFLKFENWRKCDLVRSSCIF